jgi:hypothetical protein
MAMIYTTAMVYCLRCYVKPLRKIRSLKRSSAHSRCPLLGDRASRLPSLQIRAPTYANKFICSGTSGILPNLNRRYGTDRFHCPSAEEFVDSPSRLLNSFNQVRGFVPCAMRPRKRSFSTKLPQLRRISPLVHVM